MELVVNRTDLQTELQLCQAVVERRSTIPVLSNVLLRASGDRIDLTATDLDVTIEASCPAKIKEDGAITIEAKRFFDIVRSLPDDEVRLKLGDNDSIQLQSGSAVFRLLGRAAEDFPAIPEVDASRTFDVRFDDLKTMIEKVIFAITHEETRFQLNGALLKLNGSDMEMVATDGHRMALITYPQEGLDAPSDSPLKILIPRKALQEISKIESTGEETVRVGLAESHIFFETGSRRILARLIDVNFPNYNDVISRDNDKRVTVDRERLLSTIRRVSLVSTERMRALKLEFEKGQLTVSSMSSDLGDAHETVPIEYSGPDFRIGLNATYVSDFLAATDTEKVVMDLRDEESQCIARPMGEDELAYEYLYVIMPMKIS